MSTEIKCEKLPDINLQILRKTSRIISIFTDDLVEDKRFSSDNKLAAIFGIWINDSVVEAINKLLQFPFVVRNKTYKFIWFKHSFFLVKIMLLDLKELHYLILEIFIRKYKYQFKTCFFYFFPIYTKYKYLDIAKHIFNITFLCDTYKYIGNIT